MTSIVHVTDSRRVNRTLVHLASLAQIDKVDDCAKSPAIAEPQTHGSFPKLDHIYESWVLSPGFLDANGHPSTRVYPSAYIN